MDQIGSFDVGHLQRHAPFVPDFDERLFTTTVPTMTLASLHRHLGRPNVDLLHVDAEGFDEAILDQVEPADLGLHAVLFEHAHLPPQSVDRILRRFAKAGLHETRRSGLDVLVVRS